MIFYITYFSRVTSRIFPLFSFRNWTSQTSWLINICKQRMFSFMQIRNRAVVATLNCFIHKTWAVVSNTRYIKHCTCNISCACYCFPHKRKRASFVTIYCIYSVIPRRFLEWVRHTRKKSKYLFYGFPDRVTEMRIIA